jgi:hypothetical protein
MKQLEQLSESLWVFQGSQLHFYGFPFTTRMTIVRLTDQSLWIHSPEKLNDSLQAELAEIGQVAYLISPNKLHHLFLDEWLVAYPLAKSYAAPGLISKRKDLRFDAELKPDAEAAWSDEILQALFKGSPLMQEVVFFHKQSETLILTDLIENVDPKSLNFWQRVVARFAGILAPHGHMPIDWRLSFKFGNRTEAKESLSVMIGWKPKNIIVSHGKCIFGDGERFLNESFSWLVK